MASKSNKSTKNAAALAGKKSRPSRRLFGSFPLIAAGVVVAGLGLVAWSRETRPAADASAPSVTDHWHHAYGFYMCDTWFSLEGDLSESDENGLVNPSFARAGIHSHDDGVIHWHAATSAAVGTRATLGLFLDLYDVELSSDVIRFNERQSDALKAVGVTSGDRGDSGTEFVAEQTSCNINGEATDASIVVKVWDNFTDTDEGVTYIAGFNDIRLDTDGKVVAIGFVTDAGDLTQPPWTADLPELALVDTAPAGVVPAPAENTGSPATSNSSTTGP